MKRETAKRLVKTVNDPYVMEDLLAYVEDRIETLREWLDTEKVPQKIYEHQGAIAELKKFRTLRDEVLKEVKE